MAKYSTEKIQMIPVDELVFDPENPRLPQTIRKNKDSKDYETLVVDWMLQFENVIELMGSIGEKGFFVAEPLLVVEVPNTGKFEVVEGNRRLTATKLLNHPELATKRQNSLKEAVAEAKVITTELPVVVFQNRSEVLAYLGYKHITGVEAWDSLAKAKYLKQLLATITDGNLDSKCRTLAKLIGSRSGYVKLLLIGVDVFSEIEKADFFHIPGLNEENFEFGVFYTALNRTNIGKYVGIDFDSDTPISNVNTDKLGDLTKWIFEPLPDGSTKLGESRNLQKLDRVLDDRFPKALVAFKEGRTLEEASRLTDHPDIIFEKGLNDSLIYLEQARNNIHMIENPTQTQSDILKQIFRIAQDMYRLVETKKLEKDITDI